MTTTCRMNKSYEELITIADFYERLKYLQTHNKHNDITFGENRYLNQKFYSDPFWKHIRDQVIIRDNGMDLGIEGRPIEGRIIVHHINPIRPEDLIERNPLVYDLNNLICVSHMTHEDIHYYRTREDYKPRTMNDTCPWR